jgi:hypothetical protein
MLRLLHRGGATRPMRGRTASLEQAPQYTRAARPALFSVELALSVSWFGECVAFI